MFIDPVEHHGVPHEAVLFFENPVVFVRESKEAGGNTTLLENVEGGKAFAVWKKEDVS